MKYLGSAGGANVGTWWNSGCDCRSTRRRRPRVTGGPPRPASCWHRRRWCAQSGSWSPGPAGGAASPTRASGATCGCAACAPRVRRSRSSTSGGRRARRALSRTPARSPSTSGAWLRWRPTWRATGLRWPGCGRRSRRCSTRRGCGHCAPKKCSKKTRCGESRSDCAGSFGDWRRCWRRRSTPAGDDARAHRRWFRRIRRGRGASTARVPPMNDATAETGWPRRSRIRQPIRQDDQT